MMDETIQIISYRNINIYNWKAEGEFQTIYM